MRANFRAFASRVKGLFVSRSLDTDFAQELESHLQLLTEENILRGMSLDQARRAARLKLGGPSELRESHHDQRTLPLLESMQQDVRFALRMLRKNPGFTAVAVLTLALGIGANTAIFSLINAVILRSLPVEDPEQLVEMQIHRQDAYPIVTSFSYVEYQRLRDQNQVFSGLITASNTSLHFTSGTQTEATSGQFVSGNFFSVLGVSPFIGRTILPSDDSSGENPSVAVISYGLWQRSFGGDPSIIGRQIEIETLPFTIVGVAAPKFSGLQVGISQDFWVPMSAEPLVHAQSWLPQPGSHWIGIVGRLKPGVTSAAARTNLGVVYGQMVAEQAAQMREGRSKQIFLAQKIDVAPAANGLSRLRRQFSKPLLILMVLVGLVLIIACANVASLLLARATSRRRELAVRLALGASGRRLMRQFLTESLVLSSVGGAAGLILAFFASNFLVRFMSATPVPLVIDLRPDIRVLLFTVVVSLSSGTLFGIAPAFRATQLDAGPNLKERAPSLTSGRPGARLGKALIVSQIALSLLILVSAGLFVGTLRNLKTFDPGFDSDNVLLASVDPGRAGYKDAQLSGFYHQLLDRLNQQPGARSASLSMMSPVAGGGVELSVSVEGYVPHPDEDNSVYVNRVSPGYFATVRTPLLLGGDFRAQDSPASPPVAIINETMAQYYFHGASPIGRHVTLAGNTPVELEIVGVVKDSKYINLREEIHRTIFTNCFQAPKMPGSLDLEIRTEASPLALAPAVRSAVAEISSTVPVSSFGTLDEQVDRSITQERLVAALSGSFGALALLLACIGLYGLMSYSVGTRVSEIGIRMALGAERANVVWMILRESLALAALGVVIGVPIALVTARLVANEISGLLFGLSATSKATVVFACAALVGSAALASCVPAIRASRVDPASAMRCE
jgi:putative ABC transport system permease protein